MAWTVDFYVDAGGLRAGGSISELPAEEAPRQASGIDRQVEGAWANSAFPIFLASRWQGARAQDTVWKDPASDSVFRGRQSGIYLIARSGQGLGKVGEIGY